jgi:hypothetical protein
METQTTKKIAVAELDVEIAYWLEVFKSNGMSDKEVSKLQIAFTCVAQSSREKLIKEITNLK